MSKDMVFLVAVQVNVPDPHEKHVDSHDRIGGCGMTLCRGVTAEDVSRERAEEAVMRALPRPGQPLLLNNENPDAVGRIECWWIAEDDRHDGSDNDSAIFVTPGTTQVAYEVLHKAGLTPDCNDPSKEHSETGNGWYEVEYRTDTTYTEDQLLDMLAEGGPFPEGTRFMVLPPIEEE